MTSQTRKFIELSDILSLELKCKGCGSTITIPFSRDMSNRDSAGKLSFCPICQRTWANSQGATCAPHLVRFSTALGDLREAFTDSGIGFTLTFEISSAPVSSAKD
jgi:hypothetical protein